MAQIRLELPTWLGYTDKIDWQQKRKVTIDTNPADIRVILDDSGTLTEPDIFIERQDGVLVGAFPRQRWRSGRRPGDPPEVPED